MGDSKNAISISIIVAVVSAAIIQVVMGGNPLGREATLGYTYTYCRMLTSLGIGVVVGGAAFGVLKAMGK
jgi:hypothetical protein